MANAEPGAPDTSSPRTIPPDKIKENPENPRLIWKTKELEDLLQSIEQNGVIVPLIIYPERDHYVLLDGARRLRCARRLNLNMNPGLHPSFAFALPGAGQSTGEVLKGFLVISCSEERLCCRSM